MIVNNFAAETDFFMFNRLFHKSFILHIILLHDWEGNTGEYSVRGWQYWPDRREGQYITRELNIPLYCPTQKECNNRFINLVGGKEKEKERRKRKKK